MGDRIEKKIETMLFFIDSSELVVKETRGQELKVFLITLILFPFFLLNAFTVKVHILLLSVFFSTLLCRFSSDDFSFS